MVVGTALYMAWISIVTRKGVRLMVRRRGDNIPPVSEYSHWNEEAEAMWFLENRYDMEHADEIIEDDDDDFDDKEDE